MKKIKLLIFAVTVALIAVACNSSTKTEQSNSGASINAFDTTAIASGESYYQCPMHPDQISNKTGSCTKCGMDLEKVVKH